MHQKDELVHKKDKIVRVENAAQKDELGRISEPVLPKNQAEKWHKKEEFVPLSPARGWFRSFRWQSLKEQNVLAVFPPARGGSDDESKMGNSHNSPTNGNDKEKERIKCGECNKNVVNGVIPYFYLYIFDALRPPTLNENTSSLATTRGFLMPLNLKQG